MFECHERGRSAKYKLTSTVMLVLETGTVTKAESKGMEEARGEGGVTLSGSMTRQVRENLLPREGFWLIGRTGRGG